MFRILRRLYRRHRHDPPAKIRFANRSWTWSELERGVVALGMIGSGKSYSLDELIRQLINMRSPIMAACVKPDEIDRYIRLCKEMGATDRLVNVTFDSGHSVDLMQLLADSPHGSPALAAKFLVQDLGDIARRSGKGGENAGFWIDTQEGMVRNAIAVCQAANGRIPSLKEVNRFIMTAPGTLEQAKEPKYDVKLPEILDSNGEPILAGEFSTLMRKLAQGKNPAHLDIYNAAYDQFMVELPSDHRVRGGALAGLNGLTRRLTDPQWAQFLNKNSLPFERIEAEGLIVAINTPPMVYGAPGRLMIALWIMLFQQYLMRRSPAQLEVPTVILRDEFPWVLNPGFDAAATAVLRSQRVIDIALAQDINIIQAALGGGDQARHEALSFLNNHAIKFMFANASQDTNDYASHLGGMYHEVKVSAGGQAIQGDFMAEALGCTSANWSFDYQPVVRTEAIGKLPVGHAYLFSGGEVNYVNFRETR